jgi:hypothetical protein
MKLSSARLLGVLGLLFLLFLASPLSAQTTGAIRGEVETGGTPLPGVTVEARSPNLQGARVSVTDENGRFNLTLLPPGSYTITATLDGFAPRSQTLQLGLNQTTTTKFELTAAVSAEVTVTAQAVAVETQSNTVGRNVDDKVFQALPTGRNYASVAQLASGVNTDNSDVRQTSITVYGATGLENAYLVDGANTTGVEIGSQGKVLNFEFIQEVELKAGGYEAEYTGAQGGILNVVTKSGGNEFSGDVFGYFDNDSFQAENKHIDEITAEGIPVGFSRSDYGVDIGGFILRDSLWFFGAYDHVKNTQQRQVTTPGPSEGTITDLDTSSNLFAGKLTWTLNPSNTIIGNIFGDPTDDTGAVTPVIGPPSTYLGTVTVGGTDFGARYQGTLSAKFLLTGQFAYHREDVDTIPGPDGNQIPFLDNTGDVVTASGGFIGAEGNGQFASKQFTRYDYLIDGNYFWGNHDIKAGFAFQRIDADVFRDTAGGQVVSILAPFEDDPLQRLVYGHQFFASEDSTIDNASTAPVIATPQNDVFAVFVQDRWSILPNLTVNAGVRWEQQLIRGLDDITYINIDHFSPRVGFTWDFLNNGRSKAYASYSQFVPMIPMDMNVRSLNGERDGSTFNFSPTDLNCDPEADTEDTPCEIRGTAVDDIDPILNSPYSEEILAGVEYQMTDTVVVGVRGIYRALGRVLEDTYVGDLDNYAFFNPGDSVLAPEFSEGKRYFRGIEITAQKRLADNWMLYASYMYSTLRGNFDGAFRAVGGFFSRNPNITDDFDYPEFQVNANGNLTLDRTNQAKLQAAYIFPFGLTFSASGYYQTGLPLSRIGWWNGYAGPEIFITPRGSEGRSPDTYEMDLQADYGLRLGCVTVHFLASLFNVLDRQQVTQVDQVWALDQADNELPEPTNETYGQGNQWQQPRTLRLGVRVSF